MYILCKYSFYKVIKLGKSRAVKDRRLFVEILAHGDHLSKQADDIVKLGNQLHRVDLTVKERANIKKELDIRNQIAHDTLINHKKITENVARAQQIQTVNKESIRASELILNPEDPKMKNLKETNSEEFYFPYICTLNNLTLIVICRPINMFDY